MKVLGITDTVTTCDCCGKKNLKRTVVLDTETGVLYYGTSCAAKAMTKSEFAAKKMNSSLVDAYKYVTRINKVVATYGIAGGAKLCGNIGFASEIKEGVLHVTIFGFVMQFK